MRDLLQLWVPYIQLSDMAWAVNQDDDIWLTLRGTRHNRLCGVCLQPGDTFPGGFYNTVICEHCLAAQVITPMQHCPFGAQLQDALSASYCKLVRLVCMHIEQQLMAKTFMYSCKRPLVIEGDLFRTDAKCETGKVTFGGYHLGDGGFTPPFQRAQLKLLSL